MKKLTAVVMLLTTFSIVCLESQAQDSASMYKAWDDFLQGSKKKKTECGNHCQIGRVRS